MSLYFILIVLKLVNVVAVVIISMIHMQNYVFLMLLKTWMLKYLISRTNETRYIKWHETCKCKCRLDASVCNNKQRWDKDKFRCECK